MVVLIAFLMLLMAGVAFLAIMKGKDGVITGAVCASMTAAVTTLLVGGLHKHRVALKEAVADLKEGGPDAS